MIPVPYKVRGIIRYHIKYGGTIKVTDSYRVPAVDSNHEDTSHGQLQGSCSGLLIILYMWGDGVCLSQRTGGFNFRMSSKTQRILKLFAQYWGELWPNSPTYARFPNLLYTAELCT